MTQPKNLIQCHPGAVVSALALFALFFATAVHAQAQARYTYSPDGAQVLDSQTGLTWRRCSEGQRWIAGTCAGSATRHTHREASALARTSGWRLPNIKELSSLVDTSQWEPAIDSTAFPQTSLWLYWSSSPARGDINVWTVNFISGEVDSSPDPSSSGNHVRLVR